MKFFDELQKIQMKHKEYLIFTKYHFKVLQKMISVCKVAFARSGAKKPVL